MRRWILPFAALAILLLPGACLLTVGAPLVRRVEPGRWTVEAAGGVTTPVNAPVGNDRAGVMVRLYAGRSLGSHFEVGLLPYGYSLGNVVLPAVYVPVKWDPFPVSWPVRWVLHAGPVVFLADTLTAGGVAGTGFSFEMSPAIEAYLHASAVIPAVQLMSFAAGLRLNPTDSFSVGLGGFAGLPFLFGLELSGAVRLGGSR